MKRIPQFLADVKNEIFVKVTWPNFQEFSRATIVVLIIVVIFAVYLGLVDYSLLWLQHKVL